MLKKIVPIVLACLVLASHVQATMVLPADLGDLSREAKAIARGRVVSVESRWTADRRGIETLVTLDAESYLKGDLGTSVVFRVPGGRLGRFRSITVGAPEFLPGEHVIVFLGAQAPRIPFILGLNQGVFRLVDPGTGWTVTPPPVLPATPLALAAGPVRVVRGDPSRTPTPLGEFERRVRELAMVSR